MYIMNLIIILFATLIFQSPQTPHLSEDYAGVYTYELNTPAGPVSGEMTLVKDNNEYKGTITAYGTAYDMLDMKWDGAQLTFSSNAAGYKSKVKGTFEDNLFKGTIYVEGMEIPIKATRQ